MNYSNETGSRFSVTQRIANCIKNIGFLRLLVRHLSYIDDTMTETFPGMPTTTVPSFTNTYNTYLNTIKTYKWILMFY